VFILFYLFFGTFKLKQRGQLKHPQARNGLLRRSPQHYSIAATSLSFQHFWAMVTKAEKPACIHRGDSLNSGSWEFPNVVSPKRWPSKADKRGPIHRLIGKGG